MNCQCPKVLSVVFPLEALKKGGKGIWFPSQLTVENKQVKRCLVSLTNTPGK